MRRVNTPQKPTPPSTAVLAVALAALMSACSQPDRTRDAASSAAACAHPLLTPADVKGILRAPVTSVENAPADGHTCVFRTDTHARIEVAVRPSGGRTTVQSWLHGRMALEAAPLSGVGDQAAWQRDLHEVIAEQGDVLCDVTAVGDQSEFADTSDAFVESRLGALCVKVFDAPSATNH
jgi:hypothetical protein